MSDEDNKRSFRKNGVLNVKLLTFQEITSCLYGNICGKYTGNILAPVYFLHICIKKINVGNIPAFPHISCIFPAYCLYILILILCRAIRELQGKPVGNTLGSRIVAAVFFLNECGTMREIYYHTFPENQCLRPEETGLSPLDFKIPERHWNVFKKYAENMWEQLFYFQVSFQLVFLVIPV